MAVPNFVQVKTVNNLLNQIKELENKLAVKSKELYKEEIKVQKEEKRFRQTVEAKTKQQILLESIQKEMNELKELEQDLKLKLNREIDQEIEKFFNTGGFTKFTNELYQSLKKDSEIQVFAGSNVKQYIPVEIPEDYPQNPLALRIKTNNKTYILDIDKVKVQIKDQVFKTQVAS